MLPEFKPAWWMRNRHLQTIMPRFFRPFHNTRYDLSTINTPDGDFLELAWATPHNEQAPLAIVLHGLEGNINSFYAKGMMKKLKARLCCGVNALKLLTRSKPFSSRLSCGEQDLRFLSAI